jgi:spore photoproduct lyase
MPLMNEETAPIATAPSPPPTTGRAGRRLPLLGVGLPEPIVRSEGWIKQFPGGEGKNNCPRFYYVRDGFGCAFKCAYCYLERQTFRHPAGAEFNPDIATLYKQVEKWLKKPGDLGLILGEVTDAWGWAHMPEIRARNLQLVEAFREQQRHTLIFLTKSGRVHHYLEGIAPSDRVALSWSINAPEVADLYEMGAKQAEDRIRDARICRERGWRVRVRMDPMIPVPGWRDLYSDLAEVVAKGIRPEQVTCGSWRPRPQDDMYKTLSEFRSVREQGPDGRLRVKNRLEMYQMVWSIVRDRVPQLALCKEDLDIEAALYTKFGVRNQACNCLGRPVEPVGLVSARALVRAHRPALGRSSG